MARKEAEAQKAEIRAEVANGAGEVRETISTEEVKKMTNSFTTIYTIITKAAAEAGIRDSENYKVRIISRDSDMLEFELETGRKNQIRVHMKDLGHPIVGDQKYGNGFSIIGRLALHAYRLNFYHPMTGQVMEFETPFPQKFVQLFKEYRNDADAQEETE